MPCGAPNNNDICQCVTPTSTFQVVEWIQDADSHRYRLRIGTLLFDMKDVYHILSVISNRPPLPNEKPPTNTKTNLMPEGWKTNTWILGRDKMMPECWNLYDRVQLRFKSDARKLEDKNEGNHDWVQALVGELDSDGYPKFFYLCDTGRNSTLGTVVHIGVVHEFRRVKSQ